MFETSPPLPLRRYARPILLAFGALSIALVALTALGAIAFDTAAGVVCGAVVGGAAAAFLAARGLRKPDGRHAGARRRREDAAALDRLEPLDPPRS